MVMCNNDSLLAEATATGPLAIDPMDPDQTHTFKKEPATMPPRNVATDVCPMDPSFGTAENDLVVAIGSYETSLAFNAWLDGEITTACNNYRGALT